MYARLVTFDLDPDQIDNARGFADMFSLCLPDYDGFISVEYFRSLNKNEIKALTKWDSKELADDAIADLVDSREHAAKSFGEGNMTVEELEVYVPAV